MGKVRCNKYKLCEIEYIHEPGYMGCIHIASHEEVDSCSIVCEYFSGGATCKDCPLIKE